MLLFNHPLSLKLFLLSCVYFNCLVASNWHGKDIHSLAVITTPVVDLFINLPLQENPPASAVGTQGTCKRAYQGLLNEVVQCIEQKDDFVRIAFDGLIYGVNQANEPLNSFWISKKHLVALDTVEPHTQGTATFPIPSYERHNGSTVVLTFPWNNYSLGTRFVRVPSADSSTAYGACLYNPEAKTTQYIQIPLSCGRIEQMQSPEQARTTFITIINSLFDRVSALPGQQVVAYAWGGASATRWYKDEDKHATADGKWVRSNDPQTPYSGYDCSSLPFRIAQASGIEYPFKTTGMLSKYGTTLAPHDTLQAGDLLWIPGHVLIISNLNKNELIEMRGYDAGFGKLDRTTLGQRFQNIVTYADLLQAYHTQQPLIARTKEVTTQITDYKLIKLPVHLIAVPST